MSETVTESLEARVDELEKQLAGSKVYIQDQVDPRFDDVQDDHKSLSERMNIREGWKKHSAMRIALSSPIFTS